MSEASAEEIVWGEFEAAPPPEGQEPHQVDRPDTEEEKEVVVGKRKPRKRLFPESDEEGTEDAKGKKKRRKIEGRADEGQMEKSTPKRNEEGQQGGQPGHVHQEEDQVHQPQGEDQGGQQEDKGKEDKDEERHKSSDSDSAVICEDSDDSEEELDKLLRAVQNQGSLH